MFNQRQIMVSFAYLAYSGEELTDSNQESEILTLIGNAIPKIPPIANPAWQVVWGPATYTQPGALKQDNLMFAAQNPSDPSQIVVAVRGTNFVADLDWLMEDFDVRQMIIWPPGNSKGAAISESTSIGLQILLAMNGATQSGGVQGATMSLTSFLQTQTATGPINLCITGHSLGGSLAGTLALYLKDNPNSWDASSQSNVSCITFAAPTAGNTAFAAYSDGEFKASPNPVPPNWDTTLGTTFDAVRCNLDIAPMAWISANISDSQTSSPLFSIYSPENKVEPPNIDFSKMPGLVWPFAWKEILKDVLPDVANMLASQDYAQVVSLAEPVQGTFNPQYVGNTTSGTLLSYLQVFLAQAAYQHSFSYPIILDVSVLNESNIIVRNETPAKTTGVRMIPRLARPLMLDRLQAAAPHS